MCKPSTVFVYAALEAFFVVEMSNRRIQKLIENCGNESIPGVYGCDGHEFMLQNEVLLGILVRGS